MLMAVMVREIIEFIITKLNLLFLYPLKYIHHMLFRIGMDQPTTETTTTTNIYRETYR